MRRTQLYLDEALWHTLHLEARQKGTTISELVRQAVRERYRASSPARVAAMAAFAGSLASRRDLPPTAKYVRQLRKDTRYARLSK